MPTKNHAAPLNALDAAARLAFAEAAKLYDIADWHDLNPRTVERMARGRRDVPPGLARDVAAQLAALNGDNEPAVANLARALTAWADSRAAAEGAHHG